MEPGSTFCTSCGTRVADQPFGSAPPAQAPYETPYQTPQNFGSEAGYQAPQNFGSEVSDETRLYPRAEVPYDGRQFPGTEVGQEPQSYFGTEAPATTRPYQSGVDRYGASASGAGQGYRSAGTGPGTAPPISQAPPDQRDRRRLLLFGGLSAVAAMALVGAAWFFLGRSTDEGSTETATDIIDDDTAGEPADGVGNDDATGAGIDSAQDDSDQDESDQGDSAADQTPTTVETTTTIEPDTTGTTSLFAGRDEVYGRYVAILWSDFASTVSPPAEDEELLAQLVAYQDRFGFGVMAIDSNQFRSLRDGTIAVVYDGGFTSARDAKVWCRSNGFPGTGDCFGVVLSDDYSPDERGEFVRTYDL